MGLLRSWEDWKTAYHVPYERDERLSWNLEPQDERVDAQQRVAYVSTELLHRSHGSMMVRSHERRTVNWLQGEVKQACRCVDDWNPGR